MAQFRRGADAIAQAAKRKGGGKFAPVFKFEADETKYLQFLVPMEDIPTVLMHQFIIIGSREDGSPKYERFISRRDPGLDGPDGYDEIIDRFGLTPTERSVALAVEVEPVYGEGTGRRKKIEGFDLAMRQFEKDGETVEVPAFQLVIESPKTFFNHLAAQDDVKAIEETIWAVKRNGKGTDTTYTFIDTGEDALDVEDELNAFTETFDFEAWLDELADEERMRELIEPLPDDHRLSRFGGKGKKDDDAEAPKRGRRASSRARAADVEEDDSEPEAEPAAEKPKAGERSKRFSALRDSVKA